MKYLYLLILIPYLVLGCTDINIRKNSSEVRDYRNKRSWIYNHCAIVKIDKCEYVVFHGHQGAAIAHKGNCSNAIHKKK